MAEIEKVAEEKVTEVETKKCLLCDERIPVGEEYLCEDCDYRVKSSYYEF